MSFGARMDIEFVIEVREGVSCSLNGHVCLPNYIIIWVMSLRWLCPLPT